MKKHIILALSLVSVAFAYAQTLEEAIKKTENERFDLATGEFKNLIAKEPTRADYYFYLGENYLKQGETDQAYEAWAKASGMDAASPFTQLAGGKLKWYKGDTAAARMQFNALLKTTKNKHAEIMRQIAATYTYAPAKNLEEAIRILNEATKVDEKNVETYLILGDALLEKTPTDGGPAIKAYNQALSINEKSPKTIVRKAKVYQRGGAPKEANDLYKEAQTLDPTYAPAYRENAELNLRYNQATLAIENWKKYLELNNSVEAHYRYATALFTGNRYCEVIPEIEYLRKENFENLYTRRMMATSLLECNESNDSTINMRGLKESDEFFRTTAPEKVLASDYRYRAKLLSKMGNDSLAIEELEKAIILDTAKADELLVEIAKTALKLRKYDRAISAYERKAKGNYSNLEPAEVFDLGRAYWFGPKDFVKADTCYGTLIVLSPDYALGYAWKARTTTKLNPGNVGYKAKPYYEKYFLLVPVADRAATYNKAMILEASRYLGDYYVNSPEKDLVKATEFWTIVRELEPTDKQAESFFKTNPPK